MPEIHFICHKAENVRPIKEADGEWESGNWVVAEETAEKLVGGGLYLHEKQTHPAYFGGVILSFRRTDEDRLVFRFRFDASHKGVTSRGGWTQEKKIVL